MTTQNSLASAAPPLRSFNCRRTEFTGIVNPQTGHVTDPCRTVPSPTVRPLTFRMISKSTKLFFGRGTSRRTVEWLPLRSEEHTSELQSRPHLVCRLLLEKKK